MMESGGLGPRNKEGTETCLCALFAENSVLLFHRICGLLGAFLHVVTYILCTFFHRIASLVGRLLGILTGRLRTLLRVFRYGFGALLGILGRSLRALFGVFGCGLRTFLGVFGSILKFCTLPNSERRCTDQNEDKHHHPIEHFHRILLTGTRGGP